MAMDFGASNGRGVLGKFDGNKITMEEVHRFPNYFVPVNGVQYWDTLYLFKQILTTLEKYGANYSSHLEGIGIDTWGVDYGLLDKNGQFASMPISYRNSKDETMQHLWDNVIGRRELFDKTGLATNNFNTIYQLYERKLRDDPALQTAENLLLLPDLFAYLLSGEMGTEYTMAMTTQLTDPTTKDWDYDLIEKLGLPKDIFIPVTDSGKQRGKLLPDIADSVGLNQVPVLAVGGHDTASAVAAVPAKGNAVFLSSGTWSLFGMESDHAIINDDVYNANYSNEGTVQGTFRPLKNIMGLWSIQELKREWSRAGKEYSWNEIVERAKEADPFVSLFDPDDSRFFAPDSMVQAIQDYCKETGQPVPETVGQFARAVYESLALKYRWALERMEEIRDSKVDVLNIVGGGCQNKMLNQMTANAIQRPVVAGPIEGASIGNLLVQAKALGEIKDMDELREIVRISFDVEEYTPTDKSVWDDAYGRFIKLV